jgi:phage host-nuclease inhibitor protein Gam
MTTLYEIKEQYEKLGDMLEESQGEITPDISDLMNSIDDQRNGKIDNICRYIRNLETQGAGYINEIQRLKTNLDTSINKINSLKNLISWFFNSQGINKMETDLFKLRIQKNPPSIDVYDPDSIPKEFDIVETIHKIDKKTIMEKLKSGEDIPGARIKQGEHLRIQ